MTTCDVFIVVRIEELGFVLIGILVRECHISTFEIGLVLLVDRLKGLLVDRDISLGNVNVLLLFDFFGGAVFYLCDDINLLDFYKAVRLDHEERSIPSMVVVTRWTRE